MTGGGEPVAVLLGDVLAQPHQIGDALWRIEAAGVPRRSLAGGVAVCGGRLDAIGGDLAAAALGERATAPVRTVRGRALEPWTRADTLVLCASYSGEDEEALACFEDAGARGCSRVVVCTAGRLAARAREDGVPVIGVPSGMRGPGAAVVYMTLAALECAAAAGAGPSLRAEAEAAAALLAGVDDSRARELATALRGRVPVVCGGAEARRWAEQIEAVAGVAALWRESPGRAALPDPLTAISIDADARGETALERVLSLVLLGDLVAVQLAADG